MPDESDVWKYVYWLEEAALAALKEEMAAAGTEIAAATKCPCEALKGEIGFAAPEIWTVICKHDADVWYRPSKHAGKYLVGSSFELAERFRPFLETTLTKVPFSPPPFPSSEQKRQLADDTVFLSKKPEDWDAFPEEMREPILKGLATMPGETFHTWEELFLSWTAVHANFVHPRYRADGKLHHAPYSIAESKNISSCCVELFNLLDSEEPAMLVRPCVGATIIEAAEENQYHLVKVVRNVGKRN